MISMLELSQKEERPCKKGPFFSFKRIFSLFFILLLLFINGKVYGMNLFYLSNGLPCIFETRKGAGVVAIQVWVKAGSKFEEKDVAGITHFIEHLIFKGTEKVKANELAYRIESRGGTINAFTSYDNTVYHIVIPKDAFEEGLALLLDVVQHPSFPENEIEKEKQVVLEEIKMNEDDPQRKLFKTLFSLSYKDHPYGRPILGYEETVKGITREDILNYFKNYYVTPNMVIVIVGDFDEQRAKELIEKQFEGYTPSHLPSLQKIQVKSEEKDRLEIIEKNIKESYLALSYHIPSITHSDIPALEVAATILGEGDSSRLHENLKNKKGLVTTISTHSFTPKEDGLFVVMSTFNGRGYEAIVKAIEEEIERLSVDGPSKWEMEKARNIINASYIYADETVQGRGMQIGNFFTLTGDPLFINRFLKAVDSVTPEDVKRVLKTYITGKQKTVVSILPERASNPHVYSLENGLRFVINKNTYSPSFAFRIGFVGGLKEEPPGKNGIFNLLSKMLIKGTKDKDALAIAKEIDLLAGDISPFNGRNLFGLSGKFLSKDVKKAFFLMKELLTETFMREDEFKKTKEDIFSEIRRRDDEPISSTFQKFNEVFYAGNPYSKDPTGTEQDVKSITLEELKKYYMEYVSPQNAVLALSGDVPEKEVVDLVKQLFSSWKGNRHSLRKEKFTPSRKEVVFERDIRQSHMVFGFMGPGLLDKERSAAEVLDAILSGMSGRIHKILREEKPYAYALTFFNQMAYEVGAMGVYIGTDPKFTGEVATIVRTEIEKIRKEGFTDKEVEDAKRYLIGNHFISMQSNSAIAVAMCLDTLYGLRPDYFKIWPSYIEAVHKEDVNRVAIKYLNLDRMVEVIVGKRP